jgi:aspartate/glutamate racemase
MISLATKVGTKLLLKQGKNILHNNIVSIGAASVDIIAKIQLIGTEPVVYDEIEDMDLIPLISIVSAFAEELKFRVSKLGSSQYTALTFLNDAIVAVKQELQQIHETLEQSKKKWLYRLQLQSAPAIDCTKLRKLHERLFKRWNLLLSIL